MKGDAKGNFTIDDLGMPALSRADATYNSESVDHGLAPSCEFFISCGTFATSFVATLQYSDNDSDWTAEPDTTAGNTVSLTLTEAGNGVISCPNPRGRYTRISTVLGGTCVHSITSVLGPLRSVSV